MIADNSLTLAPPGAGLPWFEAFILRRFVFPSVTSRLNWSNTSLFFSAERDQLLKLVEPLSSAELFKQVLIKRIRGIEDSSRNWSVAMTLEHLNIVNSQIANVVVQLSKGFTISGEASTAAVKPSTSPPSDIIQRYKDSCERYLSRIENEASHEGKSTTYVHPWFGPLTALKWHALAMVHQGIHLGQIKKILEGSGLQS